ncbi:MAG: protein-L-isoaspartate O-methyltransferase [Pseudomonadota bacterium]
MVEGQVRTADVTDRSLLAVLSDLPRERFVPKAKRELAYIDGDVPVAEGRHLLSPRVLAKMIQAGDITPASAVLAIGTATGYAAAGLGRMAASVIALEADEALAKQAADLLSELEIDNAVIEVGPLAEGYSAQAPYDVIFVDGSIPQSSTALQDQLAEDGRLLTIIQPDVSGKACLFRKDGSTITKRILFDASAPPLPGFAVEPTFVF